MQTLVDEFEVTLQGYHTKGADENAEFAKASKVLSVAASQGNVRKTDGKIKWLIGDALVIQKRIQNLVKMSAFVEIVNT